MKGGGEEAYYKLQISKLTGGRGLINFLIQKLAGGGGVLNSGFTALRKSLQSFKFNQSKETCRMPSTTFKIQLISDKFRFDDEFFLDN